jgi:phage tail-like protein
MKSSDIAALLPAVFRQTAEDGTPLSALLQMMEELHEPSERVLADVNAFFDPRRAPDEFVPYLAAWVDLTRFVSGSSRRGNEVEWPIPVGQLREWVAAAARLSRWRGTPAGFRLLLETATGISGFQIREGVDRDGRSRPFHLQVRAPKAALPYRALIEQIVQIEKPAYMTVDPVEFVDGGASSA